jgi:hypothetical protein
MSLRNLTHVMPIQSMMETSKEHASHTAKSHSSESFDQEYGGILLLVVEIQCRNTLTLFSTSGSCHSSSNV